MRYSIESRDRRDAKGYGFSSFTKNTGKNATKVAKNIGKNITNMYSQKLVDSAKKSGATKVATDAVKTAPKRAIQKTAGATGDIIGNKVADNITSVSKKELNSKELFQNETNNEIPKERYISPKERKKIIDELRLI